MIQAMHLAKRRVGIRVSAARDRNHVGEFAVAQPGEGAADRGDHHGENHRRSGVVGCGDSGQREQSGADDRADAERHQVERAQRALEPVLVALGGVEQAAAIGLVAKSGLGIRASSCWFACRLWSLGPSGNRSGGVGGLYVMAAGWRRDRLVWSFGVGSPGWPSGLRSMGEPGD